MKEVVHLNLHALLPVGTWTTANITRTMHDLQIPKPRLELSERSFSYEGAKVWNDIPNAIRNVESTHLFKHVSMYADDTSLCYQSLDINKLNEVTNNDLEKLQKWLIGNKLSLNALKTESMLISTKNIGY